MAIWQIEIKDAGSAALAFASCGHSDFAHSATTDEEAALVGYEGELSLKCGIIIVTDKVDNLTGKGRGFDKCQHKIKRVTE